MATMGFFYPDVGRNSFPAVKCQQSLRGCSHNMQKGGISNLSKLFPLEKSQEFISFWQHEQAN